MQHRHRQRNRHHFTARALAAAMCLTLLGIAPVSAQRASAAQRAIPDSLLSVDMNRSEVIDRVMASWGSELPKAQVASFTTQLNALRADELLAVSLAGSFDGVLKIMQAAQRSAGTALDRAKAVGETTRDLVYTPIVPKRLLDSRGAFIPTCFPGGGAYSNGEIRSYDITASSCLPTGVSAIVATVYAGPGAVGAVSDVFADAQGGSFGAVAVEAIGQASGAFTGGTALIPVNPGNNQIAIKNAVTSANIIIDVTGHFTPANRTGDGLRVFGGGTATPSVVNGDDSNTVNAGVGATIAGGTGNTISASNATIAGGFSNTASGDKATISGGAGNRASGQSSTVGGGGYGSNSNCYDHLLQTNTAPCWNEASGQASTVAGGANNRAELPGAFVGGGEQNRASSFNSVVGGGNLNVIANGANNAVIGGGFANSITASGNTSSIVGGIGGINAGSVSFMGSGGSGTASTCYNKETELNDVACGNQIGTNVSSSVIVGGYGNTNSRFSAFIGGGGRNSVLADGAVVVGGFNNSASGDRSFIGAGIHNTTSDGSSSVVAGIGGKNAGSVSFMGSGGAGTTSNCYNHLANNNTAPCWNEIGAVGGSSVVVGGQNNVTTNAWTFIGGGEGNRILVNDSAIVGGFSNTIGAAAYNAFIGAGNQNTASGGSAAIVGGMANTASGFAASVGGGSSNTASGSVSAVAGGSSNTASNSLAFVGGGSTNTASGITATVAGGSSNSATASRATVGGGAGNSASGESATVPGGRSNSASGAWSFAAGRGARTSDSATPANNHFGTFVWADSPDDGTGATPAGTQVFRSSGNNQFAVRARGGVVFKVDTATIAANAGDATAGCSLPAGGAASWSCSSDRNLKEAIHAISPKAILAKVTALPLSTWQFKGTERRHMSPMAQDFWAAFGLGVNDKAITSSDVSGVALGAIQGLNQKLATQLKQKDAEIAALKRDMAAIKRKLGL